MAPGIGSTWGRTRASSRSGCSPIRKAGWRSSPATKSRGDSRVCRTDPGAIMSYIQQSLAPGEKIVALFHLHWLVWLRMWVVLVLGAVIVAALLWLEFSAVDGTGRGFGWAALVVAVVTFFLAL